MTIEQLQQAYLDALDKFLALHIELEADGVTDDKLDTHPEVQVAYKVKEDAYKAFDAARDAS